MVRVAGCPARQCRVTSSTASSMQVTSLGNRQELKDLVQAALDRGERRLLIDFSRTGYIDSSGLGALVSISKRIRELGGELRLSGLNEDLRSLFELTKLDTLFAIAETPQQALASF